MNQLQIRNRTWKVPSKFEELSEKQFLQIVNWLMLPIEIQVKRIKIVSVLLKLKWRFYLKYLIYNVLSDEERFDLMNLYTDFIFDENNFCFPFFRKIRHKGIDYHSPQKYLKNISLAEFERADYYYQQLNAKPEALDSLVAVLYRPADPAKDELSEGFDGDIRVEFNENTVERRAKELANLSIHYKMAILKYYVSCMAYIQKSFADLFASSDGKPTTWFEIWHSIAENPKDMTVMGKQNIYLVLYDLRKRKEKAEELEKQYAK